MAVSSGRACHGIERARQEGFRVRLAAADRWNIRPRGNALENGNNKALEGKDKCLSSTTRPRLVVTKIQL